ncbi:MAG: hypothetical protein IPK75_12825 [Acidobacteria bacterium]|nr:hypothetical protein [Acidobacteriota bacterium]
MAGVLIDAVDATLRRWAREPFAWGETDCALSVFRHVAEAWGDARALSRWVGRYRDEPGAQSILRGKGGPVRAFQDELVSIGARRVRSPQRGAVGLVRDGRDKLVAAVCLRDGWWAARTASGFAAFRASAIVAFDKAGN